MTNQDPIFLRKMGDLVSNCLSCHKATPNHDSGLYFIYNCFAGMEIIDCPPGLSGTGKIGVGHVKPEEWLSEGKVIIIRSKEKKKQMHTKNLRLKL